MTAAGRPALARAERGADKRMMAIVPGGFDEDAAQMGVAGFGDAALGAFRAARVLGGHEADEGHGAAGPWRSDGDRRARRRWSGR